MLILSQSTDTIEVSLAATVANSELECFASWRDITATPSYTAGRSPAMTTGTFPVEIISSPAIGTQRVIDHVSIYNVDTAAATVTVKLNADSTTYTLWSGIVLSGERLGYEDGKGWHRINSTGIEKTSARGILKVLGQSNPSATALTTAYTVPSSTMSEVNSIMVCNRSATATSFRIAVRPLGASISNEHYIYYDVPIAGNDTFEASLGMNLAATDVVSVYATLATLSFNIFGQEHS